MTAFVQNYLLRGAIGSSVEHVWRYRVVDTRVWSQDGIEGYLGKFSLSEMEMVLGMPFLRKLISRRL